MVERKAVNPCHICGRPAAFASRICDDEDGCVDIGRAKLGMNPNWIRLRERYPWMGKKKEKRGNQAVSLRKDHPVFAAPTYPPS